MTVTGALGGSDHMDFGQTIPFTLRTAVPAWIADLATLRVVDGCVMPIAASLSSLKVALGRRPE
jgi:hypothetical protein